MFIIPTHTFFVSLARPSPRRTSVSLPLKSGLDYSVTVRTVFPEGVVPVSGLSSSQVRRRIVSRGS